MADISKPMVGLGPGVFEIALRFRGDAFRVVYAGQIAEEIWVVQLSRRNRRRASRRRTAKLRDQGSPEEIEGDAAMNREKLEVVRGSGNVFRDLGRGNADADQFKAILATEIIKALDREHLTVRAAHNRTGITAADFSRIRNANLGRFTVDRLMSIINRLGSRVEVKIRLHRSETVASEAR
jgi:predicted XRE-type DNA-binding protein